MEERTGHGRSGLRTIPVVAAVVGTAALAAWGGPGVPGRHTGLGGRAEAQQPDREYGAQAPGATPVPLPDPTPVGRNDRWIFDEAGARPEEAPVLEVVGNLASIDGTEVVIAGGDELPPTSAGLAISLAGDTTYYVAGRPTTFDQVPRDVPARVTYVLRGERRVALRVEVPRGPMAPALPGPEP